VSRQYSHLSPGPLWPQYRTRGEQEGEQGVARGVPPPGASHLQHRSRRTGSPCASSPAASAAVAVTYSGRRFMPPTHAPRGWHRDQKSNRGVSDHHFWPGAQSRPRPEVGAHATAENDPKPDHRPQSVVEDCAAPCAICYTNLAGQSDGVQRRFSGCISDQGAQRLASLLPPLVGDSQIYEWLPWRGGATIGRGLGPPKRPETGAPGAAVLSA
jgi:hypothetical protein